MAHEAGKGDMYRSVDQKKFDENFEKIFGQRIKNQKLSNADMYEYELDKSTGEVIKKNVTT
jgi:hypothetical protein